MPALEVLLQHVLLNLCLPNAVLKHQVLRIVGAVDRLKLDRLLHQFAILLAEIAARNWLQLLEICDHRREWLLRLLLDRLEQSLPISVILLARLVAEDGSRTNDREL